MWDKKYLSFLHVRLLGASRGAKSLQNTRLRRYHHRLNKQHSMRSREVVLANICFHWLESFSFFVVLIYSSKVATISFQLTANSLAIEAEASPEKGFKYLLVEHTRFYKPSTAQQSGEEKSSRKTDWIQIEGQHCLRTHDFSRISDMLL